MRRTLRLLASVKPARYIEAGAPTGLAGLYANATPRSTLLYLYTQTLNKLRAVPESSVYRQSVEAVTKHRMGLVKAVKPEGYDEWLAGARKTLGIKPEDIQGMAGRSESNGLFLVSQRRPDKDVRDEEWDGEPDEGPELEGPRTAEERKDQEAIFREFEGVNTEWEDAEPKLTAAQIEELEAKIGAGLIEEVIQVAEGELRLVDTMVEAKAWESLDEKPNQGQWEYFERKE